MLKYSFRGGECSAMDTEGGLFGDAGDYIEYMGRSLCKVPISAFQRTNDVVQVCSGDRIESSLICSGNDLGSTKRPSSWAYGIQCSLLSIRQVPSQILAI